MKRIVCLANSRKLNGRCVAGIEITDGQRLGWIRPVSTREHQEVSEYERQYGNGADPRVLDIMDVPLLKAQPHEYQQENWLLDPGQYWVKTGAAAWDDLGRLVDPLGPLWIDGHHTYYGRNNKIPVTQARTLRNSLRLIAVNFVMVDVFSPGEAFGNPKRRVQGHFRHHGAEYRLWITDPQYEREYLAKPNGHYEIGESFLTVSLGEPFNDACYKLIAAIVERSECHT